VAVAEVEEAAAMLLRGGTTPTLRRQVAVALAAPLTAATCPRFVAIVAAARATTPTPVQAHPAVAAVAALRPSLAVADAVAVLLHLDEADARRLEVVEAALQAVVPARATCASNAANLATGRPIAPIASSPHDRHVGVQHARFSMRSFSITL